MTSLPVYIMQPAAIWQGMIRISDSLLKCKNLAASWIAKKGTIDLDDWPLFIFLKSLTAVLECTRMLTRV